MEHFRSADDDRLASGPGDRVSVCTGLLTWQVRDVVHRRSWDRDDTRILRDGECCQGEVARHHEEANSGPAECGNDFADLGAEWVDDGYKADEGEARLGLLCHFGFVLGCTGRGFDVRFADDLTGEQDAALALG